ncbi:hypothetical protein ARMGADRAFT_296858 [Armillaria gallica]|uniref:Uncharacterized protein n=1 Tax=Armillaria gallica TaxID=47427 RepID=A0A2H3DHN8_ARMGA|nr:hypothetical protein ARMGADRAFT_296858 [Armillaria gallica]
MDPVRMAGSRSQTSLMLLYPLNGLSITTKEEPVYQTASLDATKNLRTVIILKGKGLLSDWNAVSNALYKATYNVHTIKRGEISIMCPVFFTEADLSAHNGQLIWGKTTWISGQRNIGPDKVTGVSSFDVLDALVAYYLH